MDALILAVAILAAYRLTRFVTRDDGPWDLCRKLRRRYTRLDALGRPANLAGKLLYCPWCVGFWISLAVTVLLAMGQYYLWYYLLLLPWAVSAGVGIIANIVDVSAQEQALEDVGLLPDNMEGDNGAV